MDQIKLSQAQLAGLLKQSARDMRNLMAEKETLMKFARAVEILPSLEKSGAVSFPTNMPFSEKALKLAGKTSSEIEKMAYMAEHINSSVLIDDAKLASADGDKEVYGNGYGKLTNRLITKTL